MEKTALYYRCRECAYDITDVFYEKKTVTRMRGC